MIYATCLCLLAFPLDIANYFNLLTIIKMKARINDTLKNKRKIVGQEAIETSCEVDERLFGVRNLR